MVFPMSLTWSGVARKKGRRRKVQILISSVAHDPAGGHFCEVSAPPLTSETEKVFGADPEHARGLAKVRLRYLLKDYELLEDDGSPSMVLKEITNEAGQ